MKKSCAYKQVFTVVSTDSLFNRSLSLLLFTLSKYTFAFMFSCSDFEKLKIKLNTLGVKMNFPHQFQIIFPECEFKEHHKS